MKDLIRVFPLLLLTLISCSSPKKMEQQDKDVRSFRMYLTNDLAINSCLFLWENMEKNLLEQIKANKIPLYNEEACATVIPFGELEKALSFDVSTNDGMIERLIWDRIQLKNTGKAIAVYLPNPFQGDAEKIAGYIPKGKWESGLNPEEILLITLFREKMGFEQQPANWNSSRVYTYALLLLDSLQKEMTQLSVKGKINCFNEEGQPLTDSSLRQEMTQQADVWNAQTQRYENIRVPIPDQDMRKGWMIYGKLGDNHQNWVETGLLYHPASKYGGYNPGNILLFKAKNEQLKLLWNLEQSFVETIADFALLCLADPEQYTCQYYQSNSITIQNKRYPHK